MSTTATKISVAKLQQEMQDFRNEYTKDCEVNAEAHKQLLEGQEHLEKVIIDWMDSADEKYASKWVQGAVIGGFVTAATVLLGIIIFVVEGHFKF